tara:strand:+ start:1286 stop:1753 length:468 start_codon:yes stop_codon:yes gene_type:complete
MKFKVNGKSVTVEIIHEDTPLLWVLRDQLGLAGTKFGCGIGQCGACTVLLDDAAIFSCSVPISLLEGREITTIEGLADSSSELHPLQQAWIDHDVPQCGYCQSGQLMRASALLKDNPSPTMDEIDSALEGNLCRCGTYVRIRKAVMSVADGKYKD